MKGPLSAHNLDKDPFLEITTISRAKIAYLYSKLWCRLGISRIVNFADIQIVGYPQNCKI